MTLDRAQATSRPRTGIRMWPYVYPQETTVEAPFTTASLGSVGTCMTPKDTAGRMCGGGWGDGAGQASPADQRCGRRDLEPNRGSPASGPAGQDGESIRVPLGEVGPVGPPVRSGLWDKVVRPNRLAGAQGPRMRTVRASRASRRVRHDRGEPVRTGLMVPPGPAGPAGTAALAQAILRRARTC